MTTLVHKQRLNRMETSRPGMVASVGDTLVTPQLAVSTPGMPIRFEKQFYDRPGNGSLMTPQPYVLDSNWNMERSEKTAYGLIQQDLRAPDKLHEPTVVGVPQYGWYNKVATVYEAKRRGFNFLPLPGPYQLAPGETSRGTQIVRVTDTEGLPTFTEQEMAPQIFGKNGTIMSAPTTALETVVTNRPLPNLVNSTSNFSMKAPGSGFGTSARYAKV
jgi:hypothetical protein